MARETRSLATDVEISGRTVALAFGLIVLVVLMRGVIVAARRPLGWAVASVIAASFLAPLVERAAQHMRRIFALLLVLLVTAATVGFVFWGVLHDLDVQSKRLYDAAPKAAHNIEQSKRFGRAARDFDLEQRVTDAVKTLRKRSTKLAGKAASRAGTYFVCAILTIFVLSWGPRMATAAGEQIRDPVRRTRVEHIAADAFGRWQHYIVGSVLQGLAYGVVTWIVLRLLSVPAPTPLALVVAFISIVPYMGVILGSVPALLITAGLQSFGRAGVLLAIFVGLQLVHIWITQPEIVNHSLYVGPLVLVFTIVIGYRVYGMGGAVFGSAIAVLLVAVLQAASLEPETG
ncbi:MAG TPA: AI-2E family transporter [Acidimicrobiia bacterium]|jgi:predicted PurR-regulated permease PerM|nr:AI-2E family transporter [Acidimicrobiia bacterium]